MPAPVLTASPHHSRGSSARRLPWRGIALGLLLIPFNTLWVQHSEVVRETAQPTMASLFFTAVLTLLGVTLLNRTVARIHPRSALSGGELYLVYAMVSVATALAGHDQIEVLVPVISYVRHFASPESRWEEKLFPSLPDHLVVSDPDALSRYYNGHSYLTPENVRPWLGPGLWWLGFLCLLGLTMVSLNLIFRQRWTEGEKLSYPLLTVPVQVVEQLDSLRGDGLFWLGFAIAGGIDLLNGLHVFYPFIPALRVTAHDLLPGQNTELLRAFGYMPIAFYPWAIGLGLLLPKDFLLTCWVFFWVWKLQRVSGVLAGLSHVPRFPYVNEQSFGAYLGIALFALWRARGYLVQVARTVVSSGGPLNESREALRYRWAALGAVCGFLGCVWFAARGGMSPWIATAYFGLYLCLSLAFTRARGEMGVPAHDLHASGPDAMLVSTFGSRSFSAGTLTMFSLFWWLTRAHRSHPMPHELEALELGRRGGARPTATLVAILLAIVAGAIAGLLGELYLGHKHGLALVQSDSAYFGREAWSQLDARLSTPSAPDPRAGVAIGVGAAATLLLLWLRTVFLWWPFHPLGYAVSSSLSGHLLWMPLFLAWAAKSAVMRYGGVTTHRKLVPLAMGLILGEYVVGGGWSLYGWARQAATYRFWSY